MNEHKQHFNVTSKFFRLFIYLFAVVKPFLRISEPPSIYEQGPFLFVFALKNWNYPQPTA